MESLKKSRTKNFLVILIIYILATISGLYTFSILDGTHSLLRLFAADFIATVVVWPEYKEYVKRVRKII